MVWDLIQCSAKQYGNGVMRKLANHHFRQHRDCQFVEVSEHGGWFLGFRRDGTIWLTANDAAKGDGGPVPQSFSGRVVSYPDIREETTEALATVAS